MINVAHADRLNGVHPDLVRVVTACSATCPFPFMVVEGLRSIAEEEKNVASGASQTTVQRSRHLDGHAVDLGCMPNGSLIWEPYSYYETLAQHMKAAAAQENVPIEWGGDWHTFKDGTHFQLPWAQYP